MFVIMVNGMKIRTLRESQGVTTKEFSEKMYIGLSTLACIENNIRNPSIGILKRIADYFGCTVDELLEPGA